ncbi:exported hypothetical protein [metagenome]|uniref:Uncharacterized protein n=1 Tax=metagenome TaxID=256318 RepID=A0A2P2C2E6_9ZZZZ
MIRTIALLLATTLTSAVLVSTASATPGPRTPGHPRTCVGCWMPGDQ